MRSHVALMRGIISGDPLLRIEILRRIARWWVPNYRFKWPQMAWWYNQGFNAYLDRFQEREGFNTDRRWMLYQLMRLVDTIPGDTAECGVYRGASSYLICTMNAMHGGQRMHYIFDSFEGLSSPTTLDGQHWSGGDLACDQEQVRANLSGFSNVTLLKGWIPDRFIDVDDHKFAFVHIDVDLTQPTLDSIAFFYPRLSPGGVLICDDYGFTSCPGATRAIDSYLEDKPEKMLSLSCGGGFLIKGTPTISAPI